MPGPAAFARRIRRLAEGVEDNTNRAVGRAAIAISQAVILATPVQFGGARANWQASIDTPIRDVTPTLDPSGNATIAKNNGVIGRRKSGQTIFISNNLGYIQFLNEGSSSQAPAMFVELAVRQGVNAIRGGKILS